jgi:hypothetical protein
MSWVMPIAHQRHREVGPERAAVLADEPLLHREPVEVPRDHPGEQRLVGRDVVGVRVVGERACGELLAGVAEQPAQGLVGERGAAVQVHHADADRRGLDHGVEQGEPLGLGSEQRAQVVLRRLPSRAVHLPSHPLRRRHAGVA